MSTLTEIRATMAQGEIPDLADLFYALRGENTDLAFTLAELLALVKANIQEGVAPLTMADSNMMLTPAMHDSTLMMTADELTLTVSEDVGIGWAVFIMAENPTTNIVAPAGYQAPPSLGPGYWMLLRALDDETDPENPVPIISYVPIRQPDRQAVHVPDADPTDLNSLASSINALRDSLVNAQLMAGA